MPWLLDSNGQVVKSAGASAEILPDLNDAALAEKYIRHPEELSEKAEFFERIGQAAFRAKLRALPLAQRSQAVEEERRSRCIEERKRLATCVRYIKDSGNWTNDYRKHFPNLQPDRIMNSGKTFEYDLDGDSRLSWDNPSSYGPSSDDTANGSPASSFTITAGEYNNAISESLVLYEPEVFRQSNRAASIPHAISPETRRRALEAGIDLDRTNYQGTITQEFLHNAMLTREESCSVHVTLIHPNASKKDILNIVHEGGIQKFTYQPPVPGVHLTAAANIAFKEVQPARRFLARCQQGITIGGIRIHAVLNRNRMKAFDSTKFYQTRVLQFTVHAEVDMEVLHDTLREGIEFELVEAREWMEVDGMKTIEFVFDSIEGQSRQAFKAFCVLSNNPMSIYSGCFVKYGPDPCDAGYRMGFSTL